MKYKHIERHELARNDTKSVVLRRGPEYDGVLTQEQSETLPSYSVGFYFYSEHKLWYLLFWSQLIQELSRIFLHFLFKKTKHEHVYVFEVMARFSQKFCLLPTFLSDF